MNFFKSYKIGSFTIIKGLSQNRIRSQNMSAMIVNKTDDPLDPSISYALPLSYGKAFLELQAKVFFLSQMEKVGFMKLHICRD